MSKALSTTSTPFFIFSVEPLQEALTELAQLRKALPVLVRHWLSCKTQPVRPLLRWWRDQGFGIEVVSEFEFLAAMKEGFTPDKILINGPAKHRWLPQHRVARVRVNFDSMQEIEVLLPLALELDWSVGIRCQTTEEFNPEDRAFPTQFGLQPNEAAVALKRLMHSGARVGTIHFHLRTNVASPDSYGRALDQVAEICQAARFAPRYLDCGGGLPAHNVLSHRGLAYDRTFSLDELAAIYARAVRKFPGLTELWLENGRFLTARSGVLVVQIHDVKESPTIRHLICDGGRTLNALVSTWEEHEMFCIPQRTGPSRMTAVCGPTCMAFDRLSRRPMPRSLQMGDHLVWMDAGAYHLSWETQFSHGRAGVLWHEAERLELIRRPAQFEDWWGQWI